jgi:hypothetical protein
LIDLILLVLGSTVLQDGQFEFIPHTFGMNQTTICYVAPDWTNNILQWNYDNRISDNEVNEVFAYLWLENIIYPVDPQTDGCSTQTHSIPSYNT